MIRCAQVRRLLEPLADAELDGATATAVRAHMNDCPSCTAAYEEAVSLPARLRALAGPEPPPSLVPIVLDRLTTGRRLGRLGWILLVPEAVLVAFVTWYVSGPAGLADLASSTVSDASQYLAWAWGLSDPPVGAAADSLLTLALALLAALAFGHLTVLARTGPRRPV